MIALLCYDDLLAAPTSDLSSPLLCYNLKTCMPVSCAIRWCWPKRIRHSSETVWGTKLPSQAHPSHGTTALVVLFRIPSGNHPQHDKGQTTNLAFSVASAPPQADRTHKPLTCTPGRPSALCAEHTPWAMNIREPGRHATQVAVSSSCRKGQKPQITREEGSVAFCKHCCRRCSGGWSIVRPYHD